MIPEDVPKIAFTMLFFLNPAIQFAQIACILSKATPNPSVNPPTLSNNLTIAKPAMPPTRNIGFINMALDRDSTPIVIAFILDTANAAINATAAPVTPTSIFLKVIQPSPLASMDLSISFIGPITKEVIECDTSAIVFITLANRTDKLSPTRLHALSTVPAEFFISSMASVSFAIPTSDVKVETAFIASTESNSLPSSTTEPPVFCFMSSKKPTMPLDASAA